MSDATFTVSIQGEGVADVPATGQTVREILTSRGVSMDTPVLVNGAPATLDSVIPAAAVVSASKAGKGA